MSLTFVTARTVALAVRLVYAFTQGMVKVLHIHDMDYLKDRHTLPFLGQLNWDKIVSALKSVDYDGNLSFEVGPYLNRFPDELIPEALRFAHSIGRYLISEFEK